VVCEFCDGAQLARILEDATQASGEAALVRGGNRHVSPLSGELHDRREILRCGWGIHTVDRRGPPERTERDGVPFAAHDVFASEVPVCPSGGVDLCDDATHKGERVGHFDDAGWGSRGQVGPTRVDAQQRSSGFAVDQLDDVGMTQVPEDITFTVQLSLGSVINGGLLDDVPLTVSALDAPDVETRPVSSVLSHGTAS